MAFDADQYLEALQPPTYTHGGRTYVGRILSFEEWVRLAPDLKRAAKGEMDYLGLRLFARRVCAAMFPRPWWKPGPSVASLVLSLPLAAQRDALADFFRSQARAMGIEMEQPAPTSTTD